MSWGGSTTRERGRLLRRTHDINIHTIGNRQRNVLVAPPPPLLSRRRLHLPIRLHHIADGGLMGLVQHVLGPQERLQVRALLIYQRGLCVAVPDADGGLGGLEGEHDAADLGAVPVEGLCDDLPHDTPPKVYAALPRDGDGPAPPADVCRVLPQRLDSFPEQLDAGLLWENGKVAENVKVLPELWDAPDSPYVPDCTGAGGIINIAGVINGTVAIAVAVIANGTVINVVIAVVNGIVIDGTIIVSGVIIVVMDVGGCGGDNEYGWWFCGDGCDFGGRGGRGGGSGLVG